MLLDRPTDDSITQLSQRGEQAVAELFLKCADRLERMIDFRLDSRLYGRVDSSDVLQEAYIEIARRIDDYLAAPNVSFFVWARQITWQKLADVQRQHFRQKRNAGQEVALHSRRNGSSTSASVARKLVAQLTSPSQAAMRAEQITVLQEAVDSMDKIDREVLALRHFELLSNVEMAEVLGLSNTAASNRYVRALKRLKQILTKLPDFPDAQVPKEGPQG